MYIYISWHNKKNKSHMDELNNIRFWLDIASEFESSREKELQRYPYRFNLINELGANENAHTRIMLQLLSYKEGNNYRFLCSFIDMLCRTNSIYSLQILNPVIIYNKDYIDGLIEDRSKEYAIIIENKICNAPDQYKQIERYYKQVISYGVRKECIFVIYLTLDGRKKVSEYSLPDSLRKELEGNFVEMNYKDNILPWLKNDILPNIMRKDYLLESGIEQYIDYLEYELGISNLDKLIQGAMNDFIYEKLNLKDKSLQDKWNFLNQSITELNNLRNSLSELQKNESDMLIQSWDAISKTYFPGMTSNQINIGYYQIFLKDISDYIHFEWKLEVQKLFNSNSHTIALHVENGDMLRLSRNDMLREIAIQCGYECNFSDEKRNVVAICKNYFCDKPFSLMSDFERGNFLKIAYDEVKLIKETIETTFHKLDREENCIQDLCSSLNENNNIVEKWRTYPESKDAIWDLLVSFNANSNEIGIESSFSINKEGLIVFRIYITVWQKKHWSVYKDRIKKHYPDYFIDDKSDRVYLHLPEIIIGYDLNSWTDKKNDIISSLNEVYAYMETLKQ